MKSQGHFVNDIHFFLRQVMMIGNDAYLDACTMQNSHFLIWHFLASLDSHNCTLEQSRSPS